tara:strand:- start:1693 stop:2733 length:1041 start_codon:yes stop_codon:yes gene_type:complete
MARSYNSYFKEREKDKPYRTAEMALGFLGDLISQNNQQSLDYQKLALQEEATQATAQHRKDLLGSKTVTLPGGQIMQLNPETKRYDVQIGGQGAGVQNWAEIYGKQFFDEYLDGQIAYEDTNSSGTLGDEGDRTFVGPDAQLFRNFQTAKVNGEPGYESLYPDVVIDGYKNLDAVADPKKTMEMVAYLKEKEDYEKKLQSFEKFKGIRPGATANEVIAFKKSEEKRYKPKPLTTRDRISIQGLMNAKNRIVAQLASEGRATETTVYSGASMAYYSDEPLDGNAIASGLEQSRKSLKEINLTPELIKQYNSQLSDINNRLAAYDITFSGSPESYGKTADDDPYGLFD